MPGPTAKFEAVVKEMVELHKAKSADYAEGDDAYSNFRRSGDQVHISAWDSTEVMIATKQARLRELTRPEKYEAGPKNESLRDTLIDRAVYSIIALILFDEEQNAQG